MNVHSEDPLYINVGAFLNLKGSHECIGFAMDLVTIVWWPTKSAFEFDPASITEQINQVAPTRKLTPAKTRKLCEGAREFFTVLPDGRWAPSPEFFSITDGSPLSQM